MTEPEVRSTANAMLSFMEQIGSAAAPAIAGLIAVRASLGTAILGICTSAWSRGAPGQGQVREHSIA
ncbi:MAG: hypothetical protein NTU62_17690 [Spirochaetes bacterium]|nr:hypothetical protein [Spirochaetota bacterium]